MGEADHDEQVERLEREVGLLVRRSRRVLRTLARQLHPDLDAGSYAVLVAIARSAPLRLVELAEEFGLDKSTMSRQVSALLRTGLVRRSPDPLDGRVGSTVYLGQYFQIARSYDPTTAGLLTLPLVGGLVLASTGSGQLISRYGRWKAYLVAGAVLVTAGLGLLATIDHTTPVPRIGGFLAILGLGIGMSMQNLVLAVQNTVDVRDVGAASSLVAFLRSLGGTIGVTILGVVLDARVTALSGTSSGLGGLATDTPAQAEAVRAAYGDGLALVFGIAAVASLVTLVAVLLIREVPLRTTVGPAPERTGPDTTRTADGRRADSDRADLGRADTGRADTGRADTGRADADRADSGRVDPGPACAVDHAGAPRPAEPTTGGPRHGSRTEARDRLLAVLLPRPQEALRALDDIGAAQRDLRATRDRLDASLARLRAIGLDEHQLGRVVGTGR